MHCDLDLCPFDPKINRAHPQLIGSLCVKFHNDRCKGIAIMRHKSFSVINALWPWPLDPKINRVHPLLLRNLCVNDLKINRVHLWLMGSLCLKFHDDRCKGKAVMRLNHFTLQGVYTNRRTGLFQYTPLTSLRGGGGHKKQRGRDMVVFQWELMKYGEVHVLV